MELLTGILLVCLSIYALVTLYQTHATKHYLIPKLWVDSVYMENVRVPFIKGLPFKNTMTAWLRKQGIGSESSQIEFTQPSLKGWF